MDDKQLTDLFRAAADDAGAVAPPPTFDHDDVLAGSRKVARRQRATVAVAVAAMATLSVGAVFSGILRGPSQPSALAESPPASSAQPEDATTAGNAPAEGIAPGAPIPGFAAGAPVPGIAPGAPVPGIAPQMAQAPYAAKSAPHLNALNAAPGAAPNVASGAAPDAADSAGPSARSKVLAGPGGGCAAADPRIFTQLTAVLPATGNATPLAVPNGCGPGGAGVAVDVNDAGAIGTIEAVLTPPTVNPGLPPDSATQATAIAQTPSGAVVRLTAAGTTPGTIPYRARLTQLAAALAAHL